MCIQSSSQKFMVSKLLLLSVLVHGQRMQVVPCGHSFIFWVALWAFRSQLSRSHRAEIYWFKRLMSAMVGSVSSVLGGGHPAVVAWGCYNMVRVDSMALMECDTMARDQRDATREFRNALVNRLGCYLPHPTVRGEEKQLYHANGVCF